MIPDSTHHGLARDRGFLRRVASRPYRPDRDEREDRLTEIVAAVLEHPECDAVAPYLVQGWLSVIAGRQTGPLSERALVLMDEMARAGRLTHVLTQLPIETVASGPRRIDLVLIFAMENTDLTIYVEAKIDAKPERGQLFGYVEALGSRPGLVILTAPRSRYVGFAPDQVPDEVAGIPWETTADLLRSYVPAGAADQLLVDELLAYMKEEDLVDPEKLDADHIASLVHYNDAWRGLVRVLDIADDYLHREWGAKLDDGEDATERWREYPSRLPPGPDGLSSDIEGFTWDVLWDAGRWFPDRKTGIPIFTVGVFRRPWMSTLTDSVLADHGFELFSRESGTWRGGREARIYRRAELDDEQIDLLAHGTLLAQGEALGAWIKQAFTALAEAVSSPAVRQEFLARTLQ